MSRRPKSPAAPAPIELSATVTRPPIFVGPGEMATRCREFDWASTSLGPPETWSQSLRTTADAVVASRNPMLLFWGPDLIQFYNDAFRPSLGRGDGPHARHPRALGARAEEFWADVWSVVGPQIHGVVTRGEAVWFENLHLPIEREGKLDDAWWTYSYSPVRDDDGRINGCLVVCLETTAAVKAQHQLESQVLDRERVAAERERLLAAAESARAEAEAANRAKANFLAVMSHELRTPLNAIAGYVDLIEMEVHGPTNDELRRFLDRIRRSQTHLLSLINQVLEFAKIDAGTVSYDIRPTIVADVLASCEALVAPQADAKHLTLQNLGAAADVVVRADAEKFEQILLNLLTNALKFTDRGGRVAFGAHRDGERILVTVTDTGVGIAAHELDRVFQPFVQVDPNFTRTQHGIGLGLAISRDFARGMKGELTVESTPGTGSAFTLSLPAA